MLSGVKLKTSKMIFKLLVLLLIPSNNDPVYAQSVDNMIFEECYPCKDVPVPNEKINYTLVPKTFSSPQVLDILCGTSIPIGNQIRMTIDIELQNKLLNKPWQHLFTIEDDFCRVIKFYLGPLVYDIETAMGIPKGVCPIPRGNYHAINFTADFNRMRLQTIPFGKIRGTVRFYEKPNKIPVMCRVHIVSNRH